MGNGDFQPMKQKYSLFVIAAIIGVAPVFNVFAKTCSAGEHLMTSACRDCPAGCYCTQTSTKLDPKDKISNSEKADWCARKRSTCSNSGKDGYGDCGKPEGGVNRCPTNFPDSAAKSTSIEQCYTVVGSKKLYYKKITCIAGKYLPINSDQCTTCPSGKECPGIENVYPSIKTDQGIGDKKASENSNIIDVAPGQFLPGNTGTPKQCTGTNRYCPGGTFMRSNKEQGRYECPKGSRVNDNLSGCKMTLTKEQMESGTKGNSVCWAHTDSEDYLSCVGIKIAEVSTATDTSNTTTSTNDNSKRIDIKLPQKLIKEKAIQKIVDTNLVSAPAMQVAMPIERSAKKVIKR